MSERKGLSILIPIFNYDVRQLVKTLYEQGNQYNLAFEILCYDDASLENFIIINRELSILPKVKFRELPENLGRAKIRNLMARDAAFENLLFLDCDSGIDNSLFLKTYSDFFANPVVVGGRIYSELPPKNRDFILHWLAGKKKEERNAEDRTKDPYANFMFNNIQIQKGTFAKIQLDENILGYGHEDSKFSYLLKENKISILHINNPVIHVGLDDNKAFINKTKDAVPNLNILIKQGYGTDTKLYKYYLILRKLGILKFFNRIVSYFNTIIQQNLHSSNPSLFFLDLYKLNLFIQEQKRNN